MPGEPRLRPAHPARAAPSNSAAMKIALQSDPPFAQPSPNPCAQRTVARPAPRSPATGGTGAAASCGVARAASRAAPGHLSVPLGTARMSRSQLLGCFRAERRCARRARVRRRPAARHGVRKARLSARRESKAREGAVRARLVGAGGRSLETFTLPSLSVLFSLLRCP